MTLWRDKLHETCHSVTYPATAKIVARQVARKVELNSTFGNGSCDLSRNDFGRCRVCYTVKCFVQLVPPQCHQNIARQVARDISQYNSALSVAGSRCRQNLKYGNFTSSFGRRHHKIAPKSVSHVQRDCFSSVNQSYY